MGGINETTRLGVDGRKVCIVNVPRQVNTLGCFRGTHDLAAFPAPGSCNDQIHIRVYELVDKQLESLYREGEVFAGLNGAEGEQEG